MGEESIRRIMVLGSVPSLGPVVLFDNIEDLLKWTKADGVGDSVLEKSQTLVYNGDQALHIKSRTTGAAENDEVYAQRELYQRPGQRYRFECFFAIDEDEQAKYVDFLIYVFDGTLQHVVSVRHDPVNHKWQYLNPGATLTDIPGGAQHLQRDTYHRLLLEWDAVSKEYIKFVCDALEQDLSGTAYYSGSDPAAVRMLLKIGLTAGGTPPGELYFDDVLVMEI